MDNIFEHPLHKGNNKLQHNPNSCRNSYSFFWTLSVSRGVLATAEGKVFIQLAWTRRDLLQICGKMINREVSSARYRRYTPAFDRETSVTAQLAPFVPLRLPPYARDPLDTHAWPQIRLERPVGSIRSSRELATFKVRDDIGISIACFLGVFLYNTLIIWLSCMMPSMTKLIWYHFNEISPHIFKLGCTKHLNVLNEDYSDW